MDPESEKGRKDGGAAWEGEVIVLEETYQRDLNHNYMIVKAKKQEYEGFSERIFQENQIPGFLPCQFRSFDGCLYFYYEISAKQSLAQLFRKRKLAKEELLRIITGLRDSQQMAEAFLLDFRKVLLLPQYLYTDFNVTRLYVCYYPDCQEENSLEALGNFILENVDYQDQGTVELAYSFHREIMEENVSLEYLVESITEGKKIFIKEENRIELQEAARKQTSANISDDVILKPIEDGTESIKNQVYEDNGNSLQGLRKILRTFIKKITAFKLPLGFAREEEQKRYEVELDIEEEPYTAYAQPVEATQFFSGEEIELHYLYYQGNEKHSNFTLEVFPFVIGKGEKGIDGRIINPLVSRIHSQVDYVDKSYYLTDLNSTNGTYLNGQRLEPRQQIKLTPGDYIQFARVPYLFQ